MRRVWEPRAVNADKLAEEGEFAPEQLARGLHMNFSKRRRAAPSRSASRRSTCSPYRSLPTDRGAPPREARTGAEGMRAALGFRATRDPPVLP
eukprot:378475-Pyramimonas_sp.AAC.1